MKKDKQRLFEVMGHVNPEFKKINENDQLTNQDQQVLSMLLGETINEGIDFKSFFNKYKGAIQKGLVTAGVLTALLSNPSFSQEQKQQIQNLAQTEQSDKPNIGSAEKRAAYYGDTPYYVKHNASILMDLEPEFKLAITRLWQKYFEEEHNTYANDSESRSDATYKMFGGSDEEVTNRNMVGSLWEMGTNKNDKSLDPMRKYIQKLVDHYGKNHQDKFYGNN